MVSDDVVYEEARLPISNFIFILIHSGLEDTQVPFRKHRLWHITYIYYINVM